MYKLKEKKWSTGTTSHYLVHPDGTEELISPGLVERTIWNSTLEFGKYLVDKMNRTVVSDKIIYPT